MEPTSSNKRVTRTRKTSRGRNKYQLSLTNQRDVLHHGKRAANRLSFAGIFGIRKLDSLGYRMALFA